MNARKENHVKEVMEAMSKKNKPAGSVAEEYIDIVFDGPPSHEGPRFIEVENRLGKSIYPWSWQMRGDGHWVIRVPVAVEEVREVVEPNGLYGEAMQDLANHETPLGQAEARVRELEAELAALKARHELGKSSYTELRIAVRDLVSDLEGIELKPRRAKALLAQIHMRVQKFAAWQLTLPWLNWDKERMYDGVKAPKSWDIPAHPLVEPQKLYDPKRASDMRGLRYEDTL